MIAYVGTLSNAETITYTVIALAVVVGTWKRGPGAQMSLACTILVFVLGTYALTSGHAETEGHDGSNLSWWWSETRAGFSGDGGGS